MCSSVLVAMVLSSYNEPQCKLYSCQKDLRLAVNMSDTVDQPLHVGSAVNEVRRAELYSLNMGVVVRGDVDLSAGCLYARLSVSSPWQRRTI